MLKSAFTILLAVSVVCLATTVYGAGIVVVDCNTTVHRAYFGFYGSQYFADQPAKLFDDTVKWAVSSANPNSTTVLLFTDNGTVNDYPANRYAIGFYDLLRTSGYNVLLDSRLKFAQRTNYSGINLVIYPNFDDRRADNVLTANIPFISMEPGQSNEMNIGTGVAFTYPGGAVNRALVVDNGIQITNVYMNGQIIPMAYNGMPGTLYDIPTEGITIAGRGRILVGEVPEPATMTLVGAAALALLGLRRRRNRTP